MNKLITTNVGGHPWTLDDFRFEQDANRNAFLALAGAFGINNEDGYILQGATVTFSGPNYDVAAGYITLQGEIFEVLAASVPPPGGGQRLVWAIDSSFDPAGNKTYDSGGTFDTYELRRAHVISAIVNPSSLEALDTPTIQQKILEQSGALQQWTTIDLNGSTDLTQNDNGTGTGNDISLVTNPQLGSYLKYIVTGKRVEIQFALISLKTTTHDVSNCASLKLENLPFTFKGNHRGIWNGECTNFAGSISGNHRFSCLDGESTILFNNIAPFQPSIASFNRLYTWDTAPSMDVAPAAGTANEHVWVIYGGGTFEIN